MTPMYSHPSRDFSWRYWAWVMSMSPLTAVLVVCVCFLAYFSCVTNAIAFSGVLRTLPCRLLQRRDACTSASLHLTVRFAKRWSSTMYLPQHSAGLSHRTPQCRLSMVNRKVDSQENSKKWKGSSGATSSSETSPSTTSRVGVLTDSKYYERSPYSAVGLKPLNTPNQDQGAAALAHPVHGETTSCLPQVLTESGLRNLIKPSLLAMSRKPRMMTEREIATKLALTAHGKQTRIESDIRDATVSPLAKKPGKVYSPVNTPVRDPNAKADERLYEHVGNIVAPHGMKGDVKVQSTTDHPAFRFKPGVLYLTYDSSRPVGVQVQSGKLIQQDQCALLKIGGIDNREYSNAIVGSSLYASRADIPPLRDGEYLDGDVVGCNVVLVDYPTHKPTTDRMLVQHPDNSKDVASPDHNTYTVLSGENTKTHGESDSTMTSTSEPPVSKPAGQQQLSNASAVITSPPSSPLSPTSLSQSSLPTSMDNDYRCTSADGQPAAQLSPLRVKVASLKASSAPKGKRLRKFEIGRATRFISRNKTTAKDSRVRNAADDMMEVTLYSEFLYLIQTSLKDYVVPPYTLHTNSTTSPEDNKKTALTALTQAVAESPSSAESDYAECTKKTSTCPYSGEESQKPSPPADPPLWVCEACDRHIFEDKDAALKHEKECLKLKLKRLRRKGIRPSPDNVIKEFEAIHLEDGSIVTRQQLESMNPEQHVINPKHWLSRRKILVPMTKDSIIRNMDKQTKTIDVALSWSVFHEEVAYHK
eukprot:GHVQ01042649.1.p1 GENE.GHVQ01042649.1~~GHVQ01042649.1.p1  ORF type:complete len:757 (+),score=80.96 GHVQ01042649.1:3804-6074(+)